MTGGTDWGCFVETVTRTNIGKGWEGGAKLDGQSTLVDIVRELCWREVPPPIIFSMGMRLLGHPKRVSWGGWGYGGGLAAGLGGRCGGFAAG